MLAGGAWVQGRGEGNVGSKIYGSEAGKLEIMIGGDDIYDCRI
jgi:hypothetical protein